MVTLYYFILFFKKFFFYLYFLINLCYFLGILAILNGIFPNDVHQFVYLSLGEFLDLLSLINCNTCFIVYPLISTQYRETLKSFIKIIRHKFYYCNIIRLICCKETISKHKKLQNGACYCLGTKKKCKYCQHYKNHKGIGQNSHSHLLTPNTYNQNISFYLNSNNASFYFTSAPSSPDVCTTLQPAVISTPTLSNAVAETMNACNNNSLFDNNNINNNINNFENNNSNISDIEIKNNVVDLLQNKFLTIVPTAPIKQQLKNHKILLLSNSTTIIKPIINKNINNTNNNNNSSSLLRFINDVDVLL